MLPNRSFPIYQDLARRTLPLNKGHLPHAVNDKYKVLPANVEIIQAAEELINIERVASLRFLYLYCLGIDNVYFSKLLDSIVGTNNELLEFSKRIGSTHGAFHAMPMNWVFRPGN